MIFIDISNNPLILDKHTYTCGEKDLIFPFKVESCSKLFYLSRFGIEIKIEQFFKDTFMVIIRSSSGIYSSIGYFSITYFYNI